MLVLSVGCGAPARVVDRREPPPLRPPAILQGPAPQRLALSDASRLRIDGQGACAIGRDERVRCWGAAWTVTPTTVPWIERAVEVAGTPGIACARVSGGQVHCWSDLEDPDQRIRIAIDDAIDLASTGDELCAVRASGRIACWGGSYEQSGSWREPGEGRRPVGVPEVDAAWAHVTERDGVIDALALRGAPGGWCAIRRSGALACWGRISVPGHDPYSGSAPHAVFPVPGVDDAKDISFAGEDVCVLGRGGGVICTGQSTRGAPLVVIRPTAPAPLPAPEGWGRMPDSASVHALLPRAGDLGASFCGWGDEGLRCWPSLGERARMFAIVFGRQLSLDPVAFEPVPGEHLRELGYFEGSVARSDAGEGCALFERGPARCWGPREILGRPVTRRSPRPRPVPGLDAITWLTAAGAYTCAGGVAGTWCWGAGWWQHSPTYESEPVPQPQPLDGGSGPVWAARGTLCRADGAQLRCRGELARLARENQPPERALAAGDPELWWAVPGLSPASITVGGAELCSFASGRTTCVGRAPSGDGDEGPFDLAPRARPALGVVVDLDLRGSSGCAVRRGGAVVCFGAAFSGSSDGAALRPIEGVEDATEVAAGSSVSCARTPGALRCWRADRRAYVLEGVVDPIAFDVGAHHVCAIERGGAVVCSGRGSHGETGLPEGVRTGRVEGLPPATQIALGDAHSCALVEGGHVYCWGDDESEQLGDGPALRYSATPLAVEGTE